MAKLTLNDLANLTNQTTVVTTINSNNAAIETALENTLSRDGTAPNSMGADLDMNSNKIINLPDPVSDQEPATKSYVDESVEAGLGSTNLSKLNYITVTQAVDLDTMETDVAASKTVTDYLETGLTTEILVGGGASTLPVWTTATGSGSPVRATSPTLVTPEIGTATGSKLTLTGTGPTLKVLPTITLANTGGSTTEAVTGSWITGTMSGSTDAYVSPLTYINLTETATSTGSSGISGLTVSHSLLTSPGDASRNGILSIYNHNVGTTGTNDWQKFYTGIFSLALTNVNDAGTPGSPHGSLFGYGGIAGLGNGATNWFAVCGAEFDVYVETGASVDEKLGLQVVKINGDAVKGSTTDAAIVIVDDDLGPTFGVSGGHPSWDYGIVFGKPGNRFPLDSSSTIMGAYDGTSNSRAANFGVDFNNITFSTAAFRSTGFVVDPIGGVTASSILSGPIALSSANTQISLRDTLTAVDAGGLTRITSISGATYWQNNTAAAGDFSSANTVMIIGPTGIATSNYASGSTIDFGGGDVTLTHSSGLLSGTGGALYWSDSGLPMQVTNTQDSFTVGLLNLAHNRPANAASAARIQFYLNNTAGSSTLFGGFGPQTIDNTAGSESGRFNFYLISSGSLTGFMRLSPGELTPETNDGTALGSSSIAWSDLYLASGSVINWNAGDVTLTHSSNLLTFAGASSGYIFDVGVGVGGSPSTSFHTKSTSAAFRAQYNNGSGYAEMSSPSATQAVFQHVNTAGQALIDFVPKPTDGTSSAYFRFFRDTSTTGTRRIDIHRGDGTSTTDHNIYTGSSGGLVYFCKNGGNTIFGSSAIPVSTVEINGSATPVTNNTGALGSTTKSWADLFLASGGLINWANGDVTLEHVSSGILRVNGVFAVTGNVFLGSNKLFLQDPSATANLQVVVGSNLTTNRSLTITTGDADTVIDLTAGGLATVTGTQTLTNKTLASPAITGQYYITPQTLTDGATVNWDCSSGAKAKVTLAGNRTMAAVTNAVEGASYFLWVIQDATGSRTITWTTSGAGSFDFGTDGAPTLTTTANAADLLQFEAISLGGTLKLRFTGIKKGFA